MKHFKRQISRIFNSLDFFAMRPSDRITFEKTHKYSTTIGKSVSWIIIGLIIALFMNFGADMLYHKNPRSSVSQIVTPNPDYLNLKEVGFFMAFGLEDIRNFSSKYIDETIYKPKLFQRIKIGSKITIEEIPVEKCSLSHIPDNDDSLKEYFLLNQIDHLYCMRNDSNLSMELQSTWDGPVYRNILLNILPCVNSSNETICKSSEEIQAYMDNGNYVMYFTTLAVDPNNYEKPLTAYGKEIYTPISSKSSTYIEMLFAHMEFTSDEGILFQDQKTKHSATFVSSRQLTTSNPNQIVQIDIKLDKIKTTYTRYYDKIQSVLAYMGGIINFCMITSRILVLPFIKLRFKLSLANSLFNFQSGQEKQKRIPKISQTINIQLEKGNNQIVKSYFEEKNEQKLRISYISYFCSCFRNNITKIYNKLIDKGLSHVDQMLDISYLMNKLTEIDILKVLLLNKTQRELFEYIPKPEVSLENVKKLADHKLNKEISLIYERSKTEKANLAYDAYVKILGQNEKSELDKNLLEMVPKIEKIRGPKLNFVKKNSIIL